MNANGVLKTCLRSGAVAVTALMVAGIAGEAAADNGVSRKLNRQIDIMEKIVDEVLIESPNFLVSSRQNTHGIYLDEFGMLFSFEASIINDMSDDWAEKWKEFSDKFKITRENGKVTITLHDDDEDEDDEKIEWDDDDWRARLEENERKHYDDGKVELATTLIDYGDTLTGLRDGQTVAIAAFLRGGGDWFGNDDRVSTLVVKAKMADLRAFASGDISEDTMRDRISYQEY